MIFFTSDTHFNHANIIKYCDRPFKNTDEMNEAIIKNWNEAVTDKDEIYHLGDFGFGPNLDNMARRLKGKKYLIRGNHDRKNYLKKLEPYFIWIKDTYQIKVQDKDAPQGRQLIWLSHYAHKVWPQSHYGSYHLYGHSHGGMKDDITMLAFDAGVDCFDYRPISYPEVKGIMAKKNFKPISERVSK